MEHIAAVLLIIGCSGDLKDCSELPVDIAIYETYEECEADLHPTINWFSGSREKFFGPVRLCRSGHGGRGRGIGLGHRKVTGNSTLPLKRSAEMAKNIDRSAKTTSVAPVKSRLVAFCRNIPRLPIMRCKSRRAANMLPFLRGLQHVRVHEEGDCRACHDRDAGLDARPAAAAHPRGPAAGLPCGRSRRQGGDRALRRRWARRRGRAGVPTAIQTESSTNCAVEGID